MGKGNKKCGLCHVKNKRWEEQGFFGIECRELFTPMIVSSEHQAELTEDQKKIVEDLRQKYYPHLRVRGKGTENQKDHWHQHYVK